MRPLEYIYTCQKTGRVMRSPKPYLPTTSPYIPHTELEAKIFKYFGIRIIIRKQPDGKTWDIPTEMIKTWKPHIRTIKELHEFLTITVGCAPVAYIDGLGKDVKMDTPVRTVANSFTDVFTREDALDHGHRDYHIGSH